MIEIKGDNLKYDHSNERYATDSPDLGLAINMAGFYTEDELREQLAKLVEANSFAGQGRLQVETVSRGGFTSLRGHHVVRTVNGAEVSRTVCRGPNEAYALIEKVTGRWGGWAVIPAGRSLEGLDQ